VRVNDRDDCVESQHGLECVVDPERGSDGARICEARCLHDDMIKATRPGHAQEACERVGERVGGRTADTAVGELDQLDVGARA
jgi:hypothetical protein